MNTPPDFANHKILHRNRLPARSTFVRFATETEALAASGDGFAAESPTRLNLDGDWRFAWAPLPAKAPADYASLRMDDAAWDTLPVPSHWQLSGKSKYGSPWYTNWQFPFPVDPPHTPTENPTGTYRHRFHLPASWEGRRLILHFEGVDSCFECYLNGEYIGLSKGSRLPAEFDVTDKARPGEENLLAVRVWQWSDGTYLEDQDMWWLSGIFRSVSVVAAPRGARIEDLRIEASLEQNFSRGVVRAAIDMVPPTGGAVELKLFKDTESAPIASTRHGVGDSPESLSTLDLTLTVSDPLLWSAETPHLYTLLLVSRDRNGEVVECVPQRIGFRSVTVAPGGVLLVNGRHVKMRGVNRHEWHPDTGRSLTIETMMEDVLLMKRHNINMVRTSHYPPDVRFLDLCDTYGLYVMDEADLETHGFQRLERPWWLSDSADWTEAYVERIERTVARDRNHPSIIFWSMGNESGFGRNLVAMADRCRQMDTTRLIHYESDVSTQSVDMLSQMYTAADAMPGIISGETLHQRWGQELDPALVKDKPYFICEYAHAMGNGPGGLKEYWETFESSDQFCGGAVWEWIDHGVRQFTDDGKEFFAYGGDFGEQPHDGNFVCDGLLMPDRTPSAGLHEYKKVLEPVRARISEGKNSEIRLHIINRHDFQTLAHLRAEWSLTEEGRVIEEGELPAAGIAPGASMEATVLLKAAKQPGRRYHFTLRFRLRESTLWAPAGHEVATAQTLLEVRPQNATEATEQPAFSIEEEPPARIIRSAESLLRFDLARGGIAQFEAQGKPLLHGGDDATVAPRFQIWRATIDNERSGSSDSILQEWYKRHLDIMHTRINAVRAGTAPDNRALFEVDAVLAAPAADFGYSLSQTYRFGSNGVLDFSVLANPYGRWPDMIPRRGLEWTLPATLDQVTWFGRGPGESYADSCEHALYGRWEGSVDSLFVPYVMPQENGNHTGTYWVALRDSEGYGILVSGPKPFDFSAHRYTVRDLEKARHTTDLVPRPFITLHLDERQNGLGSASCGPALDPRYQLRADAFSLELRIRPLAPGDDPADLVFAP